MGSTVTLDVFLSVDGWAGSDGLPGYSVARQLSAAGLVDRLRLMVFPLLAGPSGREAVFEGVDSADLELVGHRALDGRVLLTAYRPTGEEIPRA